MEYFTERDWIDTRNQQDEPARSDSAWDGRGDVDDFIFAGELWMPSER